MVCTGLGETTVKGRRVAVRGRLCRLLLTAAGALSLCTGAAADWPVLDAYPNAEAMDSATDAEPKQRRVVLGPLKKIRNTLRPEREQFVRGSLRSVTYFIPDERRVDPVRAFFDTQLDAAGETLFACEGRSCGSSNYWANTVFDRAILYGPEQLQSYRIVRMADAPERYLAVYVAQRGTRKVYAHVELVTLAAGDEPKFADLLAAGSVIFDESPHQVEALRAFLEGDTGRGVAVVVHGGGALELDVALNDTQKRAERVRRRLVGAGIAGERIFAHGVGPLAPTSEKPPRRVELVAVDR